MNSLIIYKLTIHVFLTALRLRNALRAMLTIRIELYSVIPAILAISYSVLRILASQSAEMVLLSFYMSSATIITPKIMMAAVLSAQYNPTSTAQTLLTISQFAFLNPWR